ncbi:MAG: hypothetical protein LPL00_00825 [Alphaproteobacteria bacterium]|nr:hypothetical protein [Alphaproteobacteria bacterium]MDX5367926.1 hypothetical protein [Alphaproteobacteria bacterium]MDX5462779.1 hypothetical protein [Alphaproteobacteria bacterium]
MGFVVLAVVFAAVLAWGRLRKRLGWPDALMRAGVWTTFALAAYFVIIVIVQRAT